MAVLDNILDDQDKILNCRDSEAMSMFQHNCNNEGLLNAIRRRHIQNFDELYDLVRKYCAMEEAWQA